MALLVAADRPGQTAERAAQDLHGPAERLGGGLDGVHDLLLVVAVLQPRGHLLGGVGDHRRERLRDRPAEVQGGLLELVQLAGERLPGRHRGPAELLVELA
jgi:hypothetical protein